MNKPRATDVFSSIAKELKWILVSTGAHWRGDYCWVTVGNTSEIVTVIAIPGVEALRARVAARNERPVPVHLVRIIVDESTDRWSFSWVNKVRVTSAWLHTTIVYAAIVVPVLKALLRNVATRDEKAVTEIFVGIFRNTSTVGNRPTLRRRR